MKSKIKRNNNASTLEIGIQPMKLEDQNINKYLVYYTIGGDTKFIESLELSIKSLRLFGKYTGDILIITDNICHEEVKEHFKDCHIFNINNDCIHCEASINKLKIYTYENIKQYNKIIYLDLDILIQNDINIIFESIKNKFVFSNEYHPIAKKMMKIIDGDAYGKLLFSEKEAFVYDIENRNSINGGFFGFDISMLHNFEVMLNDLEIDREIFKNNQTNWYCEQGTINKYMITNDLYDDSISDKFVLSSASEYNVQDINLQNKIIIHFCWGVGNHEHKINYMKIWYNYLVDSKINKE